MTTCFWPSIGTIRRLFVEDMTSTGAIVKDIYDDGDRLFLRSIYARTSDLRPGDRIQGGMALRAVGPEIVIHPYILRQLCTNGAMVMATLGTRVIERCETEFPATKDLELEAFAVRLRAALHARSPESLLSETTGQLRLAMRTKVDAQLILLSLIGHAPREWASRIFPEVAARFALGPDRSTFSLMNAVTSVARDTKDPEIRWRLEEIGGEIGGGAFRHRPVEQITVADGTPWQIGSSQTVSSALLEC